MTDALIIDDNRETADALKQMLDVLDVSSRVAYGSSPAISALSKMTPRAVLLDINMPGVDGTEILAFLRREPRRRDHQACRLRWAGGGAQKGGRSKIVSVVHESSRGSCTASWIPQCNCGKNGFS